MTNRRPRQRDAVETSTDPDWRRTWSFTPKYLTYDGDLPAGPWDDEPDKIQWVDKATDLDCLMVRQHFGAWCGYVGVPRKHRFHGLPYEMIDLDVHGGLTFADRCAPGEPIDGICHIAWEGRESESWWFGFDCGRAWDVMPGLHVAHHDLRLAGAVYRDEAWVTNEVTNLAAQLAVL